MSKDFFKTSIFPHTAIIIKICRAYTNSQEDFEDYYQEVCLQIWRSRNSFKGNSEWSTWVYRLALNVCLTLHKKKKIPISQFDTNESQIVDTDKNNSGNSDNINLLYSAIRKLKDIDRAVILFYLEEKSYQEIADIIGTNSSNIGARINRIKKRLKIILDGKIN